MGDVRLGIDQLRLAERAARPVGEARGLVDARLGEVVHELLVADRIAEAADHGRDLGVEQRRRQDAAEHPDDLQVLPRGMEDLDHVLVAHQRHEGGEVEAVGQRVDHHGLVGRGHLDQAELRVIGRLAQELGVDGDEGMRGEAGAGGGQLVGRVDQVHDGRS